MTHYGLLRFVLPLLVSGLVVAACATAADIAGTRPVATRILGSDAIGDVDMGLPVVAAIDEMTAIFGEPDEDSLWVDADSPLYGECRGVELRAVGWGSLYLFFVADEPVTPENENVVSRLETYSYGYDFSRNEGGTDPRGLNLTTESGLGLGSTRAELRAAYGTDLTEAYVVDADTWTWSVNADAASFLTGLLSGPEDDAVVVLIERDPGCGDA